MFDTIGRDRDDELGPRRTKALGIMGSIGLLGFGLGVWLTPAAGPLVLQPDHDDRVVCLTCDEPKEAIEAPPEAPLARAAPAGAGDARDFDEPIDPPPLRISVPTHIQDRTGSGTGDGPDEGTGSTGTATQGCAGDSCGSGGGGSQLVHHSKLKILHKVEPAYPKEARRMGLPDARCLIDVSIDPSGRVTEASVRDCPPVFHRATRDALLEWRFEPVTTERGDPTEARSLIAVRFTR